MHEGRLHLARTDTFRHPNTQSVRRVCARRRDAVLSIYIYPLPLTLTLEMPLAVPSVCIMEPGKTIIKCMCGWYGSLLFM
jgi:hypothetical protein